MGLVGAAKLVPARVVPAILGVALLLIASRRLNEAQLGIWSVASAAAVLIATIAGAWLDQAAFRFLPLATTRDDERQFIRRHGAVLMSALGTVIVVGGIAVAFTAWSGDTIPWQLAAVTSLFAATLTAHNAAQALNLIQQKVRHYTIFEISRPLLLLIFGTATLYVISANAVPLMIASIAAALVVLPFLMRACGLFSWDWIGWRKHALQSLGYGLPLVAFTGMGQLLSTLDRYAIAYLSGPADAGVYVANAQLIAAGLALVFSPLLIVSHLKILRTGGDRFGSEHEIQRASTLFLLIAAPVAAASTIAGELLSRSLFPPAISVGHVVMPWIAMGVVGWNLGMYVHKRYELIGRTILLIPISAASLCVTAFLLLFLTPRYGIEGAAWATCLGLWSYPIFAAVLPLSPIRWTVKWRLALTSAFSAVAGLGLANYVVTTEEPVSSSFLRLLILAGIWTIALSPQSRELRDIIRN